jgi:hypothetical protein
MKNGKYEVSFYVDGKETKLGYFLLQDGSIVFEDTASKMNISLPEGPMSYATHERLQHMLDDKHNHFIIRKIS